MLRNNKILLILFWTVFFVFVFGIVKLFQFRFEAGDIYPVYSSLRSDPLGTKIFYEGLKNIDGLSVNRNLQPISKFKDQKGMSLFYFGINTYILGYADEKEVKAAEAIVNSGGRLFISLSPKAEIYKPPKHEVKKDKTKQEKTQESDKNDVKDTEKEDDRDNTKTKEKQYSDKFLSNISLEKRWGFSISDKWIYSEKGKMQMTASSKSNSILISHPITWHGRLFFENTDETWTTIYSVDEYPVIIERSFGKGTIVLATDTYFVSNEAMSKERHTDLLLWIVGGNKRIIFDETHFGIVKNPGIATLAREYRLHGFFIGVLIFSMLYIWKSSMSLIPSSGAYTNNRDFSTSRKDYLSGFVNLLRKNIPLHQLVRSCYKEWEKTSRHNRMNIDEVRRKIDPIVQSADVPHAKKQNSVEAYNEITKIILERKNT